MIFTIDYHFHPNLPRNEKKALIKCNNWWKSFEKHGVNTIIVTEHCYKNPKKAFALMTRTKPAGFYIFPGLEYVTKEGIDIIIFSQSKQIYDYNELKPFKLSYDETINFILKTNLSGYITHPYTIGRTSIISVLGRNKYLFYLNKLGSVEVTNNAFANLKELIDKPLLNKVFSKQIKRIVKTKDLPKEDYPKKIRFLAAGSDAHNPEELGTFVTVETTPRNLFKKITINTNPAITTKKYTSVNYLLLMKTAITSFEEFVEKKISKIFC